MGDTRIKNSQNTWNNFNFKIQTLKLDGHCQCQPYSDLETVIEVEENENNVEFESRRK